MQKSVVALITVGLLAILFAPVPDLVRESAAISCSELLDGSAAAEEEYEDCLSHCKADNSPLLDLDEDHLSDQVEVCFLGTDPLEDDTDGDGVMDGHDATPTEHDAPQPLKLRVFRLKSAVMQPECDVSSRWDLYFSVINFELPILELVTDFGYDGWTLAGHDHDHSYGSGDEWVTIDEAVEEVEGTGTPDGSNVVLDLDPDLTTWSGDLNSLELRLDGFLTLADHDGSPHYEGGHNDFMDLDFTGEDILKIQNNEWPFLTGMAYDADSSHIYCKAVVEIRTHLAGLDADVLSVADAGIVTPGTVINCDHARVYNCNLNQARQAWS